MLRFAFDLGSGSMGWAVYRLNDQREPVALEHLGVRIFPTGRDPKSKESNAAGRRAPRAMRRNRDRRLSRRGQLLNALIKAGLLPDGDRTAVFVKDPYELRAAACRERVDLHDLGRAIWHIAKRRGFKSNRKTDRRSEESGKIATAAQQLKAKLEAEGHPTLGSWLAAHRASGNPVRVRPTGEGAKLAYEFYPLREMLEGEFDLMWKTQARFHPELNEDARLCIRSVAFFQRPLRPVDPGRCTFFPEDPRLPKWHPLAQEFLILQQLNAVRILDERGERGLDRTVRDLAAIRLLGGEKLSWTALRRLLRVGEETRFNFEKDRGRELLSDAVSARFEGTRTKPGPLAGRWRRLDREAQAAILQLLDEVEDTDAAIVRLVAEHGLPEDAARRLEAMPLPEGHIRLGERAARAIIAELRDDVVPYSRAVELAAEHNRFGEGVEIHHSDLRCGEVYELLPPYNRVPALQRMIGNGTNIPDDPDLVRYGRITNPTVHIALGQFRRVMNALIGFYGKPAEVVIETAREMAKSGAELNEIERTIRGNTERNDKWRTELEGAQVLDPGARVGDRLLRMRLWEELGTGPADRLCPYTGRPISLHQLHSDSVEIDHILPFEDTFDDSPANKTVCFRDANRRKTKLSPSQAAERDPRFFDLEAIVARVRASSAMRHKLWRFLPDALEKWEKERGFEDRQLMATSYLAKTVRAYTETLFPIDGRSHVWVLPGRMTAMLRRRWGIHLPDHNAKTRLDHRHHALDAAVIGVIDRGMIQRLQTYSRRLGAEGADRVLPAPPEPFDGFRDAVLREVVKVHASHRPDHAVGGRLQEDTAYGEVRDVPGNQAARTIGNLVVRKPVAALTAKEVGQVRDQRLRTELREVSASVGSDKRALAAALASWSATTGHRRVRVLKPEAAARPLLDREGRPYKWLVPNEVAYLDVVTLPDGRWTHQATDGWAAAVARRSGEAVAPPPGFVMRLHKNDTLQLFDLDDEDAPIPGTNRIKRVVRIEPSANRVRLVGVNEAGDYNERHSDNDDVFRWDFATISKLKLRRARRVRIDELGRVHAVPHGVI